MSKDRTRGRWGGAVRLAGLVVFAVGAATLSMVAPGCGESESSAEPTGPVPGPVGVSAQDFVLTATPMGEANVIVCMVDVRRQRLAVYQADARRSRLKLLAVRDISADWLLADYNNDPPLPRDIRMRVERLLNPSAEESPGREEPATPETGF